MKRSVMLLSLLTVAMGELHAQRQFWFAAYGGATSEDPLFSGGLVRVDSNALNPEVVHSFDPLTLNGLASSSALLNASNGRLYGMSNAAPGVPPYRGQLFWIDPVTDSLHITVEFGTAQYPQFAQPQPRSGLLELEPGLLIGHTSGGITPGTIFKYFTANDSIVRVLTLPNSVCKAGSAPVSIQGTLFKANDGYLYGYSPPNVCKSESIVRINPALTSVTYHSLSTSYSQGFLLNGDGIRERNDTLFFTTFRGGPGDGGFNGQNGRGAIWGFDTGNLTDLLIRGLTDSIHNPWNGMVETPTGQWFGQAAGSDWTNAPGILNPLTLFSFDPVTNELVRKGPLLAPEITGSPIQGSLLAASNGKVYGSYSYGLFEYDPIVDSLRLRAPMQYQNAIGGIQGSGPFGALTEVCRKPNYKPCATSSFNVCSGAYFFYDLKNVNATSVVWRRNGVVVPDQTDQLLEFTAISGSDEGVWECTLTNACGVTVPPSITITVNAGAFTSSTITGDTLLCGTGDTAVLIGNNGGTWMGPADSAPLGTTTSTASADQPGGYYVQYTQACGLSLSNIIAVVHLDSTRAPRLLVDGFDTTADTLFFCPQGPPLVFSGNDGGPWGNLPTGLWQNGSSAPEYVVLGADTGLVRLITSNACNTDTSNSFITRWSPPPPAPQVSITDVPFGSPVDTYLCVGESLYLNSTQQEFYPVYTNGQLVANLGGGSFSQPLFIDSAGTFHVLRLPFCTGQAADTLTITVYLDTVPPPAAQILPDGDQLSGCDQDTVSLSSSSALAFWSWFDGFGTVIDSSATVQVDWGVSIYTLTPFNGCGLGPQDLISIVGLPSPDVQFNTASDTLCLSAGAINLNEGTPPGGTYSGPGVTGNTFNPAAAGIGEHSITYSYSDGTCTGFAQDVISVDICQAVRGAGVSEGLWISPNPNNGVFVLRIDSPFTLGMAAIHDALGKRISALQRVVQGNNEMSYGNLTPGMYSLRIELDGLVKVQRFVVTEVK